MKKILIVLFVFLQAAVVFAQNEDSIFIRRLADEVLVNSQAYNNLRTLTKQIGGRLAGSPQMVKAEKWGLKAMQDAGSDNAWLQECMVPHWVRGGKDVATATVGKTTRKLDVIALGNSIGSMKALNSPLILINDFEELERRKNEVKGKIVFYNYHFNPKIVRTFSAYGDAGRYRRSGPSQAAKYGAVGVIVRSISGSTDNNPHTGSTAYNDSFAKIPAVAVGLIDADWLAKQAGAGKQIVR